MLLQQESPYRNEDPKIVKFVEKNPTGIVPLHLSRHAIGCVLRGTLSIYDGDKRRVINRGELFYLGVGRHYMESIPEEGIPFELILIYYTPQELQRVVMHLNINHGLRIENTHVCENCRSSSFVVIEGNTAMRNYFQHLNGYLRENTFRSDEMVETILMTELIYLLLTKEEGCLKHRLLCSMDKEQEAFEQVIYEHIFLPISIETLAEKTNRSLTAFKKEFRRHFNKPPHKWFVSQRLHHSRLLLISTTKSVSEIGNECAFPNTSHFIKLFKRGYRMTPAAYRQHHLKPLENATVAMEHRKAEGE